MNAILVRVGIDQAYGRWNAPVDQESMEFVFVPIPEGEKTKFYPGRGNRFRDVLPAIEAFASKHGKEGRQALRWPEELTNRYMHLDPDFEYLTYGNRDNAKGTQFHYLKEDDLIVFYAGMKPLQYRKPPLTYAIIGLFVVDKVVWAREVQKSLWHENAHTRKSTSGVNDIIVRAKPGVSGRLTRCIEIGEFRNRAYRVRRPLLSAWGGLSVNDGYIQRSAVPPRFLDAARFYNWFLEQRPKLVANNFDLVRAPGTTRSKAAGSRTNAKRARTLRYTKSSDSERVIIVHLRRPRQTSASEKRDDPFYEFGSFGCTRCHSRNLMNPRRARELEGARLAFAQGGNGEFRLILLTPPVSVEFHKDRCEVRWRPINKPFRFCRAPLLVSNCGKTDFPALSDLLRAGQRSTHCTRFSSAFRSRRTPLPDHVAREVIAVYENHADAAKVTEFARIYSETMYVPPPRVDTDRRKTYDRLLREAGVIRYSCKRRKRC